MRRRKRLENEQKYLQDLPVSEVVDFAVDMLAAYSILEQEYAEDEAPPENMALCADVEGNEVVVLVEDDVLSIDLDDEEFLEISLQQDKESAAIELERDLEMKLAEQEEQERREAAQRQARVVAQRALERRATPERRPATYTVSENYDAKTTAARARWAAPATAVTPRPRDKYDSLAAALREQRRASKRQ